MDEKGHPPPEYGITDSASSQHQNPRCTGFELQANGPDRQIIKPIKAESSSSFLRAARAGNLDKLLEFLKGSMDINTSNANGLNALHLASKEGHVHVVRELLSGGAVVDAATKKGNTALHIASLAGQSEIVEILVETGAKVNVQSQNGFTPLYMAAQENHSDVVKFLLANGANQTLSTEDGFTPLAVALQQGHDRVVAVLLENDSRGKVHLPALHIAAKKDDVKATTLLLQNEHNADTNKNGGLVNDTTKSGFTPLHIACHYGNINVGRLLIDKGANVNYKARNSITPLHVAGKWGRSNMVELLLDAQANIDARTRDGLTALHCAARSGHDQVVDLLLERGASVTCKTKNGLTPLHMSSQGDHVDCARLLLYHKAPIDEVTVDYLTPLHVVAHCGNVKTAKLLLDRKCEVNARALNGFTPLHIACKKNRIKIVELLLKYGASLEATTESGLTPLHVASFMGHMNIVVFLIQHGSNPNNTTMRGETALHLAARANQTDIIRILLRNGAQVDHAKTREQQTALHISSRLGNVDNVLLLLQHGASSDAVTKDFYTPLHIAAKEGHDEVVQVLLEHGAKQTLATKRGFTPLHVAAKYGNLKVVQMLIRRGTNPNLEGKNGLTPLHVATHYNRVNVALYLLEKNASSHCATKNGYTPLHIAAKKNQMDIATTLLEHGSNSDAESRNGFTPLHLAAQEGHSDMVALLAEHGADVNCSAKNGLTPLHLTAQEDHVAVAEVLVSHKANIDLQTKAGYTPLHTASHFGQIAMIRFLLDHGAAVNSTTKLGYTPLHQAAQQGHVLVINLLLKHQASPNAITSTGQTPLSIAQRLGYISVVEILKHITTATVDPAAMEEKYKVMFPETMQEAPMSDSEEEGGEESILVDQSFQYLASTEKPFEDNNIGKENKEDFIFDQLSEKGSRRSSFGKGAFVDDTKYSKESSILPSDFKGIKDDNMIMSFSECSQTSIKMEMIQSDVVPCQYASQEITSIRTNQCYEADCYHYASSFSGVSNGHSYETSADFSSDHSTTYSGMIKWKSFLVSFMVDARGGAMRGCRHSGVRIVIPPGKACMPTRVTCRLVKKEKVMHPPALMEGEALASRILEMGPVGSRFSGPVIIEVPHFASLRGKEREITVLRSENGQTWREHTVPATEEAVHEALQGTSFTDLESADDLIEKRITRILTADVPQYFAVVARVRQETSTIGPDGGMISSTVVPRVQAIFPEGSLTKNIKVGLQVQPVPSELVSKMLGNRVAVSPIVTVEPRRRKFHKPITLTIPVPMAAQKGMLNQYGGEAPTLRLLCSIMGGTSPAQWEDITGTTPLTFINDCVSFTTTVSARFWLMDCQNVNDSAKMASDLYHEIILVPFMARFVVFAKRHDAMEARLRIFCMTDDKMDKMLENREHFKHAARSIDVEVLEGKPQYIEVGGNLVPVTKSGEKLCVGFRAFRENRLPIVVRMRDFNHEASGLMAFMREPKGARSGISQVPICTLALALPAYEPSEPPAELQELEMNYESMKKRPAEEQISMDELWLTDVADSLGSDWVKLAHQMKIDESDIAKAELQYDEDSKKARFILCLWIQKFGERATRNALQKVLKSIGHEDIMRKCIFDIGEATDAVEKTRVYFDSTAAGFDALREELGSSQGSSSVPRGDVSLDVSYEEQDILKESESIADESSTTLDGNNIGELASLDDGETIPGVDVSGKSHPEEESIADAEYHFVRGCYEPKWSVTQEPVNFSKSESNVAQGIIEKRVGVEPMVVEEHSSQKTFIDAERVIIETKAEPWPSTFSEHSNSNRSEGPDEGSTKAMALARSNIPAHHVKGQGTSSVAPSITVTEDNSIPVDDDDFVQYYGLEAYTDQDYSETDAMNSKTKDSGTEKKTGGDKKDEWEKAEAIEEQRIRPEDAAPTSSRTFETGAYDFRPEVDISEAQTNIDVGLELEEEEENVEPDDGLRVGSSIPSFLIITPQIHIQGASPVVLSPTDDSATLIGDHGGMVDMEKVCEQAAKELASEAQATSYSSSGMANTSVSRDDETDGGKGDDEGCVVLFGAGGLEPLNLHAVQAEEQDDGMGVSFEEDAENVPLSPTDYSLMDESEVYSVDVAKAFSERRAVEEKDLFSGHTASSIGVGRPPSPSDYTLLTESTEGSDLIGMMDHGMTEDVFAMPEPVEPLMEGSGALLELSSYGMIDVIEHTSSAGRALVLPPVEGAATMALDEDIGAFCAEEFEMEESVAKWSSKEQVSQSQLHAGKDSFTIHPVPAPRKTGRVEKESVCIEEKDIDEKECEEVDLERPEKGEIEDEKEYLGEKMESDDLDVELVFEFDGEDGEDMKLTDHCQPPRVPFQTPVKTSPIDILFDMGHNSGAQDAASLFLVQPEVLERKLSLFNVESFSSTKAGSAGEEEDEEENPSSERDEICVKTCCDIMRQTLDDEEASSCSSNSEVARLEEIGTHFQEPAKQLKIDEKSEETDVDDAFSPCTRDASNFEFVHPVSLSPTVQSPLERISPTAEWALKDEVSPVTVLPERLQIYVGMSPSEFTSEEPGMVEEFYLLGHRSELSVAPGGCFRPIVESGGSDELEMVFQSSAAAAKPQCETEEWVDEGFGRDASDEDSSNEEKQDDECSLKETEKPKRDFSDEGLEESLQTDLCLGASGAVELAMEDGKTDDHPEKIVLADLLLSSQNEAWNVEVKDTEVIGRKHLGEMEFPLFSPAEVMWSGQEEVVLAPEGKEEQPDIDDLEATLELLTTDVAEMDFATDRQRSRQAVQGFSQVRFHTELPEVTNAEVNEPHVNICEIYEAEVLQSILERHAMQEFHGEFSRSYLLAYAGTKAEEKRENELSEHLATVSDKFEASASVSDTSVMFLANSEPYYEVQFPDKIVVSMDSGVKEGVQSFHQSSVDPAIMENIFSNQESVDRTESPSFDSEEMDRSYGDDQRAEMAEELRTEMAEELRTEMAGDLRTEMARELRTEIEIPEDLRTEMAEDMRTEMAEDMRTEMAEDAEAENESVQHKNELQMEMATKAVLYVGTELFQNIELEQEYHATVEKRTKEWEEMTTTEMVRDLNLSKSAELNIEMEEESSTAVVEEMEKSATAAEKAENVCDLRVKLIEELNADDEEDSSKLQAELKPKVAEELKSEAEDVTVDVAEEILSETAELLAKVPECLIAEEELETDQVNILKPRREQGSWTELSDKLETDLKNKSVELIEKLNFEISKNFEEVAEDLLPSSTGDDGMLVEAFESFCQSERQDQQYISPKDRLEVKITEELLTEASDSSQALPPVDYQNPEQKSQCILSRDEPSISSEDVPKTSTSSDTSAEPTILAATYDLELGAVSRVVATYDISPDSVEKTMTMEMSTKAILSSPDDEVFETELANSKASAADARGVPANQSGNMEEVFDACIGWAMGGRGIDQQSGSFEIVGLEDVVGYDEYLERLQQNRGLMDEAPSGTVTTNLSGNLNYLEVVPCIPKVRKDAEEEEESDDEEDTFNELRCSELISAEKSVELDSSYVLDLSQQRLSVSEDGALYSPVEVRNQEYPSTSLEEENQDAPSSMVSNQMSNDEVTQGQKPAEAGDGDQSDQSNQILYDANGLSYLSSDIGGQPGSAVRAGSYSGKRALYSEATYQMFSTTEDTPEDDEDEEDFPNYGTEETLAAELSDSVSQSEDLNTEPELEKMTDSGESLLDEPQLIVGAKLVSEDAEPELLALNDEEEAEEEEEDMELENTFRRHSVRVIKCQDSLDDPDELPSFVNFCLSPRRPDLERPLSPIPDDSRRIAEDDQEQRNSCCSEKSDEEDFVSDQVLQESRSFEHIENSRTVCFSGSENSNDYGNEDLDGTRNEDKDDFLTEEDLQVSGEMSNSQVTEFVNLVLREAALVIQNDQCDMEDCGLDLDKTSERTLEEEHVMENVRFGGVGFFTEMQSALRTVHYAQNTETVQTSSCQSFSEMSSVDGQKPFIKTITEHHQTASHLENSKSEEDTELQTSFHSEVYSVDENNQSFVKTTDVEEIDSESHENEAYHRETIQEDDVEMSRRFFDENESLITETLTNQLVQCAVGEGHWERYEQMSDWLHKDTIASDSRGHSEPYNEENIEKKVSHVEVCGAKEIFEEFQEIKEMYAHMEEQKTDLNEYQDGDEFLQKGHTVLSTKFDSVGFQDESSVLDFGSGEPMSPENEGDSSSVDSFATVVPCHPDAEDRLAEISSVSSSFHSDVHTSLQEEPYISIDVRDKDENQEGSTEHEDSSSSSDRFELLDRAELDSSVIEVLPSLDSPDENDVEKDDFDASSLLTLATIREEEEKASLSGKSEKTSESSDKVDITSVCSDRMTSSPELMADSPGLTVGGRFFSSKYLEKDNISVSSSLLEFERLEKEMQDKTSLDSLTILSCGENHGKSSDKDDVSISSSLAEFEQLEGEFTQSDSMDGISLERFIGSTSSLNAFPMIDVGKQKSPLEQNLFEEQFEAETEKLVSLLEIGSLATLRQGPVVDAGAKDRGVVAEETAGRTLPSSVITDKAGAAYPQYQDIVQILRDASKGVENFEFGGRADLVEDDSEEGKLIQSESEMQDDESDSEAVVTVRTVVHGKESIDLDMEGDDDDSLQESESQSRSGTLDSELHADQMSVMQASMDSFEFDSCPVSMLPEPIPSGSEAAQLGRLLRSEVDVFSEIGNPATASHDDIRCFSTFEESGHDFCLIQSCPNDDKAVLDTEVSSDCFMDQLQPNPDRDFVGVFGGDVDEGETAPNILRKPVQGGQSMEYSSESGAWSQSDSLISVETVKSSDSSTRDIMLMSLDSPEGRNDSGAHESALRQEQMRDETTGLNVGQKVDTGAEQSEEMVEAKVVGRGGSQSTPDEGLLSFADPWLEKFKVHELDYSEDLLSSSNISHSQLSPRFPMNDLLQEGFSDCATFPDCPDLVMLDTNTHTITGVQETAVVPSTLDLSLPGDDEQVSRVILRKQIHKKTIVHDGKEETIVTEDTQIEQDPNAPVELTDSVQELIHQFLDSNGESGSADSGAPD